MRLTGAAAVLLSLWMPWYGIHVPDSLRSQIDARAGGLPPGFAAFAQGLLDAIPKNLHVSAWQAFGGADVAMAFLAGGLVLLCFATADRAIGLAVAAALASLIVVHLVARPGPSGVATLAGGAWVALAGAAVALAGSVMTDADVGPVAPMHDAPAWTLPAPDSPASVPPPR
jgi:hypothetical protein